MQKSVKNKSASSNSKTCDPLNGNPNHGLNWIRKEKRYAIYLRDGMACAYCERDLTGEQDGGVCTLDHLDPNGGNHESNLVTCCRPCNTAKAGRNVAGFASETAQNRIVGLLAKPLDMNAAKAFIASKREAPRAGADDLPSIRLSPAAMAQLARTTDKRLYELSQQQKIPAPSTDGYDVIPVLCALLALRSQSDAAAAELTTAKARKEEAEAQIAEMKAAKEAKRLVSRSDSNHAWADTIAQGVRGISRLENLSTEQKDAVFAILRGIDPPEVKEEE